MPKRWRRRSCRRTRGWSKIGTARRSALFESEWSMRLAAEWNPRLTFEPFGARGLAAAVAS